MARQSLARTQACVWLGLIITFAAIALPHLVRGIRAGYFLHATAFSSTDAYLLTVRPNSALSEPIARLLEHASPRPVVILYPEKDAVGGFLAMITAYLAWPHDVRLVPVPTASAEAELSQIDFNAIGAVIACDLPVPSAWPPGVSAGRNLHIVLSPQLAAK
jgi:hypothetical protein